MDFKVVMFVLIISLLLLHEMDAIRTKEWGMFIILKDMKDEIAYRLFSAFHLPLYFLVIFIVMNNEVKSNFILSIVIDLFLVAHTIIHFCFRKKENNNFSSLYSKTIIYSLGVLAIIHLWLQFIV